MQDIHGVPATRLRMQFLSTCVLLLAIQGCGGGESPEDAYSRGFAAGVETAKANADIAREEGRQAGFKDGYETARPSSGVAPPKGVWLTVSTVVTVAGMVKIVLSLVIFILILIIKSDSLPERLAKIVATSLAMIVVFWLSNSVTLGFSRSINDVILAPGAKTDYGKLVTGGVAAVAMWALLWGLEGLVSASHGRAYLQTLYVVLATAIIAVLVPIFISLQSAPNLFGYRLVDLTLGVVIGGVWWISHRLLVLAANLKRLRRNTIWARVENEATASSTAITRRSRASNK